MNGASRSMSSQVSNKFKKHFEYFRSNSLKMASTEERLRVAEERVRELEAAQRAALRRGLLAGRRPAPSEQKGRESCYTPAHKKAKVATGRTVREHGVYEIDPRVSP